MAADTQCTGDYTIRLQKVFRLPNGGVVGMAGKLTQAYSAVKWMLDGEQGDPPVFRGASVLIMQPDGSLSMADDEFPAIPILDKVAAIGSGAQAAMLAMSDGATAAAAVRKAAKVDPYTSEPVQQFTISLEKPKRRAR